MRVRVVAFARIREILGRASFDRDCEGAATVTAVWTALAADHPALANLRESTRFARNGAFVNLDEELDDGDELALLPPFGGG